MSTVQQIRRSAAVPEPLEPGDQLTAAEFERRYEAMPQLKKAELLEGVVYMPSPVGVPKHAAPHALVVTWLGVYHADTPGTCVSDNGSVRLDDTNVLQPDCALLLDAAAGGRTRFSAEGYVEGAPEFVAEIASSSVSIDLHTKREVYRRHGVQEYLVWRVRDGALDWFVLRGSEYERLALSPRGLYESEVFPGLWLDPAALLQNELASVLRALGTGLAAPEHRHFASALQRRLEAAPPGEQTQP